MKRDRRSIVLILMATMTVGLPGCGSSGAEAFNNTLADLQSKLGAAEKQVEDTMEWPPNDKAKEKAAVAGFRDAVADARKRFDALSPPQGEHARGARGSRR